MTNSIVVHAETIPSFDKDGMYAVKTSNWTKICENPILGAATEAFKNGASSHDKIVIKFGNGGEVGMSVGFAINYLGDTDEEDIIE